MTMINRRDFLGTAGLAAAGTSLMGSRGRAADHRRERIKIGQIGVGHAHANKLSVYRASPDYEVVGIVEPDEPLRRGAEAQALYRDLEWMTQDQLLDVPGLQAVLVETRVRDLLGAAESCVAAGKHIHLDKPAGESLPQFERILETAKENILRDYWDQDAGRGIMHAFRRKNCPEPSITLKLRGLQPKARYWIEDIDGGEPREVLGRELFDAGLKVTAAKPQTALLLTYHRLP